MGKKKFRFDNHRNVERKKAPSKLVVSIPLDALKIAQPAQDIADTQDPSSLVVKFPLSVFKSARVKDLSVLRSRLSSQMIPSGWLLAEEHTRVVVISPGPSQISPSLHGAV